MENKYLANCLGGGFWQIPERTITVFGLEMALWITHLFNWRMKLSNEDKLGEDDFFYLLQENIQERTGINFDKQRKFTTILGPPNCNCETKDCLQRQNNKEEDKKQDCNKKDCNKRKNPTPGLGFLAIERRGVPSQNFYKIDANGLIEYIERQNEQIKKNNKKGEKLNNNSTKARSCEPQGLDLENNKVNTYIEKTHIDSSCKSSFEAKEDREPNGSHFDPQNCSNNETQENIVIKEIQDQNIASNPVQPPTNNIANNTPTERWLKAFETKPVKIPRGETKVDFYVGYDPAVKDLFEYWNDKGSPLTKHTDKKFTKTLEKSLVNLQWLIVTKKNTPTEIKQTIDNYHFMLSLPYTKVPKTNAGWNVSLADFIRPDAVLKENIKNPELIPIKSWFCELIGKTKAEIELKWSKMVRDEYPRETAALKCLWNDFGGRRLDGPDDESTFRKIAKKAHSYFNEIKHTYQWVIPERSSVEAKLHYIFDMLQDQGIDFRLYDPTWLLSHKTYERLTVYWEKINMGKVGPISECERRLDAANEKRMDEERIIFGVPTGRDAIIAKIAAQNGHNKLEARV